MRILQNETIGLIIDMQSVLYPHIYKYEMLTKNTYTLIEGLKTLKIPLLITQQYTKGLGETIAPIKKLLGDYQTIEKSSFSCCDDEVFMQEISSNSKKNIIIAGIESHVCVMQTAIDLIEKGYQPIIVEDCVSSRHKKNKKIAIERMRSKGAIITGFESILFELCRYSNNEYFKSISKIVK
ncbi:MAG: hydrolase [Bacteroidetes bacterium]|jgi:nicotinamidase-related amidase|nr:hydrolase [Bacteroidota bacterium]MBT6685722.1 hydrolase [Bacteroidota bacterium]MBT7143517.1 hydrolase [Bacteroidota bacterium]MBT7492242.1 hydrolase [Bacteroidota bacterium]